MSRIGKAPIAVPGGVDVTIDGGGIRSPSRARRAPSAASFPAPSRFAANETHLLVERPNDERENRSLHGLTRTLVNNMVVGVTDGFAKELEIIGVGYRAEAVSAHHAAPGPRLQPPGDRRRPRGHHVRGARRRPAVIVRGIDKEVVGQVAANIRSIRKPEPYKGKGVRYLGEKVLRKAGKTGKK